MLMCNTYAPLHCHSYYSLLDGLCSPKEIVDRCVELGLPACAITDHGGIAGMKVFYDAARKKKVKPIIGCCLPGQEIITEDGVKNIEDINPRDRVLTHKGRYQSVTRTMSRPVNNELIYGFELWGGRTIWVTGEHPLLTRISEDGYTSKTQWMRADQIKYCKHQNKKLQWGSYLAMPVHESHPNVPICAMEMIGWDKPYHQSNGKISKLVNNNNQHDTNIGKSFDFPYIELDDDLAFMIGVFIAEGSFQKTSYGPHTGIITLNINERNLSLKCRNALRYLGINTKETLRPDKSIREIRFHHTIFCKILEGLVGSGAKDKRMHPVLMQQSPHITKQLIEGVLAGDGSKGKTGSEILKLANRTLVWQIRTLLTKFGYTSRVTTIKDHEKLAWCIQWKWSSVRYTKCDNKYVYLPIREIYIKSYTGTVYNFEVDEDHSYVSDVILHNCEMYICEQEADIKNTSNNKRHHLIVLAKNDQGIKDLMGLVSESNLPDYFYRRPRIHLAGIAPFAKRGNLIFLTACIAGELPMSLFSDFKAAVIAGRNGNVQGARAYLRPNWKDVGKAIIHKHIATFGRGNYYLELQDEGMGIQTLVVECLRELGKETGVPTVATIDSHYARREDAEDQRLLLYAQLHTTKEEQDRKIASGQDVMDFFTSDRYYIPSYDEMRKHFTEAELQTTLDIADQIEYSSLGHNPYLPIFTNEESKTLGLNSNEYLKYLCIEGAKTKLTHLNAQQKRTYWERLQRELIVIMEAGLADYFLIVWDACRFVDERNGPRGKGRGSGAGSLVNYLTGITGIDPIEYGLYFERFYNMSRNIPPHFDVGQTDFMSWMSDNFEMLHTRDIDAERKAVATHLARRMKQGKTEFTDMMREEVEWIDEKNPRMWMYLYDMIHDKPAENPSNSHLAYGLGMTLVGREELDANRRVKTHDGHISLPDIDTDIGVVFRSEVIAYLKERWGEEYVAQMITFGRLQGKAALKEVFRAHPDTVKHLMRVKAVKEGKDANDINMTPHDLCNDITQYIPDEASIADELQQARAEQGDDYGILQWAVHNVEQVQVAYEWYKPLFDQAMRIEGTKKSQSRHAAGIVIAGRPIAELVPLSYDAKNKDRVVGLEMHNAEDMGAVKFDFLGVVALDKLWKAQDLINQNEKGIET